MISSTFASVLLKILRWVLFALAAFVSLAFLIAYFKSGQINQMKQTLIGVGVMIGLGTICALLEKRFSGKE